MSRILLVGADEGMTSFMRNGLASAGHATTLATSVGESLAAAAAGDFELVILDLDVEDAAGRDPLDAFHTDQPAVPVLAVSANLDPAEISMLLGRGAIDHMAKPVQFDELLARARLRLRHPSDILDDTLECGPLRIETAARRAFADGAEIDMTAREFAVLEALARHQGQVLTRQQLVSMVWGLDVALTSNTVDVHVRNVRRKIGDGLISTVRGVGYRMDAQEPAQG